MARPYAVNPFDAPYNAVGDGIADDTVALQAAIRAANGGVLEIPCGRFKTSAPLQIRCHVRIIGSGSMDDSGGGYKGNNYFPIPTSTRGTLFLPGAHDTFQIQTNEAVSLEAFQISYAQGAASGSNYAAIRGSAAAGAGNANTRSRFKDLVITNADIGISLSNFFNFKIRDVDALYVWNGGFYFETPNYPSYGDSSVEGCEIWGGAATNSWLMFLASTGGLRVVNNKFQAGGANISSGLLIQPNVPVGQQVEPLVIAGNSFEGQTIGICFNKGPSCDAQVSQFVITGNQIWSGYACIYANPAPDPDHVWVRGGTITGNILEITGGSGMSCISVDGMSGVSVCGNFFGSNAGIGNSIFRGTQTSVIKCSGGTALGVTLVEP